MHWKLLPYVTAMLKVLLPFRLGLALYILVHLTKESTCFRWSFHLDAEVFTKPSYWICAQDVGIIVKAWGADTSKSTNRRLQAKVGLHSAKTKRIRSSGTINKTTTYHKQTCLRKLWIYKQETKTYKNSLTASVTEVRWMNFRVQKFENVG
jgi:hypothetical protein